MHIDWAMALAGLIVGFAVGLTGMGGGALMTPVLVLFFHLHPLAAVSNDLVASFFMKPVGCLVALRRRTVRLDLVRWLVIGSVPAAFGGVVLVRLVLPGPSLQGVIELALGAAMLLAVIGMAAKTLTRAMALRGGARRAEPTTARPLPTIALGAAVGGIVGLTSVGSGSLVIVALMILYPRLRMAQLVGTDLVQSVPLVGSAAIAQLLFGEVHLSVTAAIVLGSLPGVYLGARLSTVAPSRLLRAAIVVVLSTTAAKLLGANTLELGVSFGASLAAVVACAVGWTRLVSALAGIKEALAAQDRGGRRPPHPIDAGGPALEELRPDVSSGAEFLA